MAPKPKRWLYDRRNQRRVKRKLRRRYLADCLGYCSQLVDSLREFLLDSDATITQFDFELSEDAPLQGLRGRELFDFMREHYPVPFSLLVQRKGLLGAAWNLVDYVEEALEAAHRRKAAPAYALLRRPLRDDLSVLELLWHDPAALLQALEQGPNRVAHLINYGARPVPNDVIASATAALEYGWAHDAEYIYGLRYDRLLPYSFEGDWSRALHVATSARGIESSPFSFNLYYPEPDSTEETLVDLGHRLAILLHYASDLVGALMVRLDVSSPLDETRRATGRMISRVYFEQDVVARGHGELPPFAWARIVNAALLCTRCGVEFPMDVKLLDRATASGFNCSECRTSVGVEDLRVIPFLSPGEMLD